MAKADNKANDEPAPTPAEEPETALTNTQESPEGTDPDTDKAVETEQKALNGAALTTPLGPNVVTHAIGRGTMHAIISL